VLFAFRAHGPTASSSLYGTVALPSTAPFFRRRTADACLRPRRLKPG
jgi:hypothetical protein